MKYPKELYIESGFYGGDEEIGKYEEAVVERGFMDGHPVSNYICLPCIEAWLEESWQVAVEVED